MDKTVFWTVFKADLVFSLCSFALGLGLTFALVLWKKRKKAEKGPPIAILKGPRAIIVGGKDPAPAHCPLCGRDWPMPGPEEGAQLP